MAFPHRLAVTARDYRRALNYFVGKSLGLSQNNIFILSFCNGQLAMTLTYPNGPKKRQYRTSLPASGYWATEVEIRGSIVTFLRWSRLCEGLTDGCGLSLTVDRWDMEREGRSAGRLNIQGERAALALLPPANVAHATSVVFDALMARITHIDAKNLRRPPQPRSMIAKRYERDASLVRLLKQVRGSKCQLCNFTFRMRSGDTYTEAHHLDQLANGGLDVSRNMIIVCANHHRMFHFGYVEIVEHTAEQIVVRLDDEVHTISLAFVPPTAALAYTGENGHADRSRAK
jgi:hypothetical protein